MAELLEQNKPAEPADEPAMLGNPFTRFLSLFAGLSILWIMLSGRIGAQFVLMMTLSVGLVALLNGDRFYRSGAIWPLALLRYLGWMLVNIVLANVQVAYLVLHPRMPIDPRFLVFTTGLERRGAQVMLANSITLTPGTVTVDLQAGRYVVHTLVPRSAEALLAGRIQSVVGAVFAEPSQPPPTVEWVGSSTELSR